MPAENAARCRPSSVSNAHDPTYLPESAGFLVWPGCRIYPIRPAAGRWLSAVQVATHAAAAAVQIPRIVGTMSGSRTLRLALNYPRSGISRSSLVKLAKPRPTGQTVRANRDLAQGGFAHGCWLGSRWSRAGTDRRERR